MFDLGGAWRTSRAVEKGPEGPTALIGAYEPGAGPGGLRALFPLAGMALVEHQARRAVAAGAARVLLLVDELPPELADALGRLRHDGLIAGLAEGIDAAADALSPDERVLLIAEGCLPDEPLLHALATAQVPAMATLPDAPEYGAYERIDAEARWAGAALLDGYRIAETASMIGAWDPVSTLLRRAVQEDAVRIPAATPPILATDAGALAAAERAILSAARRPAEDWIGRAVFASAEELALPLLLARRVDANALALAAASLALAGGGVAWTGWRWTALTLLLLSGPAAAGAARLRRIRQRAAGYTRWLGLGRIVGAGIGAAGLARLLMRASGQWGWALMGALLIGAMLALTAACNNRKPPLWLASSDSLIWTMVPFGILGRWDLGLAALSLYACISFGWIEWRRFREDLPAP